MSTVAHQTAPPRVGLLAGWGSFPLEVARALLDQGHEVVGLGIRGHADDAQLSKLCVQYRRIGIAKIGGQIRYYRRHGVKLATMAGKIFKARLMFHRMGWWYHFPDWGCIRTYYPHFVTRTADRTDDSLMLALVNTFARSGIHFAPATDFAPELLMKTGQYSGPKLNGSQWKDIEFGWRMAKEMGRLDIGQTVIVHGGAVVAVEAVEGTDACIARAGELCRRGAFTVIKVAKPKQDMRFDVPTVGLGTLETLRAAGGRVLAVEAGKTILVERDAFLQYARAKGLVVVAVEPELIRQRAAAA